MTTSFRLEHEFPKIPLEKFLAFLNDPKLNQMIEEGLDFCERKMVKRVESPDSIEWQFSIKKSGQAPLPVEKILQGKSIGWIEDSKLVKKENCIYWRITPNNSPLKFSGEGVWRLLPYKNGSKRVIEGNITVNIPLVGKVIEGFIANEMRRSFELEVDIQDKFYASV